LLHFVAVLDLVDEDLGGFEAGDVVLVDDDRGVAGNIPGNLLLSLLVDETSEAADVNVLTSRHVLLNNGKESLHRGRNIGLVDACLFGDLIDDICLGHGM